ncbi:Neuronal calcium sensor 1 [Allomyces arbusculus]|nr:Neuronal calcium sensor 1 [Allomyces arbusculus]
MGHGPSKPKLTKEELDELVRTTHFSRRELHKWYDAFLRGCTAGAHPYNPTGRDNTPAAPAASLTRARSTTGRSRSRSITTAPDPSPTTSATNAAPGARDIPPPPPRERPALDKAAMRAMYARFFPFGDVRAFADRVLAVLDTNGDGLVEFPEFAKALATATRTGHAANDDRLVWAFRLYDADDDGYISRAEVAEVVGALEAMLGDLARGPDPDMVAPPSITAPHETDPVLDDDRHHHFLWRSWGRNSTRSLPAHQQARADHGSPTPPPAPVRRVTPASSDPHLSREQMLAARVDAMFSKMDCNQDGHVSLGEFMTAARQDPSLVQSLNLYEGLV